MATDLSSASALGPDPRALPERPLEDHTTLTMRLAKAQPSDQMLGMFFTEILEQVKNHGGEAAVAAVRAQLPPTRYFAFFRYPAAEFLALLDVVARADLPSLPLNYAQRLEHLSRSQAEALLASPVGKTLLAIAGSDPHRLLSAGASGYRSVVSFGERGYRRLGPRSAEMTYTRELLGPAFTAGLVRQVLRATCMLEGRVEVTVRCPSAEDFVIRVGW